MTPQPLASNQLQYYIYQQLLIILYLLEAYRDSLVSNMNNRAKWSQPETDALIDYLHEHQAERGDGGFKKATLAAAAEHIKVDGQIKKDWTQVKGKLNQLKEIYFLIREYTRCSGFSFTIADGTNIVKPESAIVFEAWITAKEKQRRRMRAFRNKGWEYYDIFCDIYPEGSATGRYAYHGTIGATAASGSTTSQVEGQAGDATSPDQSSFGAVYHPSVDSQQGIPTLAVSHPPVLQPAATGVLPHIPISEVTPSVASRSSNKRSHTILSQDDSVVTSTQLFSGSVPLTGNTSSLPDSGLAGPKKRSRTSISQTGATRGSQDENRNQLIAIHTMNSAIQNIRDTISTGFRNSLSVVSDATKELYNIPSLKGNSDKLLAVAEHFSSYENKASMFLSLHPEERAAYVEKVYKENCAAVNVVADPVN